jgi:hypothetical protein
MIYVPGVHDTLGTRWVLSTKNWARSMPIPGSPPRSGSGVGLGSPRVS